MKKFLNLSIIMFGVLINVACSKELLLPMTAKQHNSNVLTIADNQRLEAHIAVNTINRLAVVNDRIVNIFGEDDTFTIQTDEHTGQVFIKPTLDNGNKPIAVTLITENGVTQDLTLIPSRTNAATIILKPAALTNNTTKAEPLLPGLHAKPVPNDWLQIMKQAVLAELPLTTIKPAARKHADLQIKFNKCYQADQLLVTVWQVKNISKETKELQEKQFFKSGDLALSLQCRVLPAKAMTLLYVLGAA